MAFDALKVKEDIVKWIRDWFAENAPASLTVK